MCEKAVQSPRTSRCCGNSPLQHGAQEHSCRDRADCAFFARSATTQEVYRERLHLHEKSRGVVKVDELRFRLMEKLLLTACLAHLLLLTDARGRSISEHSTAGFKYQLPEPSTTGSNNSAQTLIPASQEVPSKGYRSNEQLFQAMKDFVARCSDISRLYSIGRSVKGVDLLVLEISDNPGEFEPEPAFKYIGNMHGDEPSGRELTLLLAEWLCSNYPTDPTAKLIVQNVHLHLLPTMNPDGFEGENRNNANDVDLNRDFPDQFVSDNNDESSRQPETRAVMEWIRKYRFTASASLHEGALVASYGWDGTASGRTGYAKAPDDGAFKYMATLYAQYNPLMRKRGEFEGGITNGAAWYPLYGGMQDWNYIHGNCFEITIEMNDEKWPHMTKIPALWEQHRRSMLNLVSSLGKSGVHGRVASAIDGESLPALISVAGNSHDINASSQYGDFHRILPPGATYFVSASFPGYELSTKTVVLPRDKPAIVEFLLHPSPTIDTVLADHPILRGSTRGKINDKVMEEVANNDTPRDESADNGVWNGRSGESDRFLADCFGCSMSYPYRDVWLISHGGATIGVLSIILCVLIRFRRSFRLQVFRRRT